VFETLTVLTSLSRARLWTLVARRASSRHRQACDCSRAVAHPRMIVEARDVQAVNPPGLTIPPGADELPSEDGVPWETNRHRIEMNLLCDTLDRHLASRRPDYFVGGNMFFYFSLLQTRKNDFRGPDVFVALGVEHRDRKSWVMWEEDGKAPEQAPSRRPCSGS